MLEDHNDQTLNFISISYFSLSTFGDLTLTAKSL